MGAGCGAHFAQFFWVNLPSSIRKECDPDLLSPSFRNLTCDLATGGHHGALAGYRVVVGGHGPEVTVDGAFEGQRTDRRVEADQGLDLLRCGCVGLDESLERSLGAVMKTSQMVTALELPNLVHDWLKAVVEGPKQLGVQVVEPGQLVGAVEAPVADQPPNDLLRERLFQSRRVIDLLEIGFAREAAEFSASDALDEDGSVCAIDW